MEPWHDELISNLNKGNLGIINSSRGIRTVNFNGENSGKENPYYMVGYDEYKIELYNIKVFKDKETVFEDINFNTIELNGYSGADSARKVLLDNYNAFYNYFSVKANNSGHE